MRISQLSATDIVGRYVTIAPSVFDPGPIVSVVILLDAIGQNVSPELQASDHPAARSRANAKRSIVTSGDYTVILK